MASPKSVIFTTMAPVSVAGSHALMSSKMFSGYKKGGRAGGRRGRSVKMKKKKHADRQPERVEKKRSNPGRRDATGRVGGEGVRQESSKENTKKKHRFYKRDTAGARAIPGKGESREVRVSVPSPKAPKPTP